MGGSAARGLPRSYVSLNRFFAMAKGSFLGVKRGKLGDAVGYNVTNSNDKDKQGWRVYQPVVANPQSDGQIDQRVKLAAVNNLYRALKPIIQRGWENHKYGDDSRRAFLKKALGASFEGPYIEKGSTLAVPIKNAPIMYGSLSPVQVECDNGAIWFMNVHVPTGGDTATVGGISQLFIDNNLALEGDQITIVLGYLTELGLVSYRTISFYVSPSDDRTCNDAFGLGFTFGEFEDISRLILDNILDGNFNLDACCALCSISRDGDNTNLRSYAEFAMSEAFETYFYGNAAAKKAAAKSSYKKTIGSNTNWEQVPGGGGYTPVVQSAFTRAGVEFTPVSIARKNVGGQNFEVIVDDGGVQYYIGSRPSAASSEIVYLSGTGSTASIDPSDLTTANSVNVFDSANTAAGLRAWLISKGIDATVLPV